MWRSEYTIKLLKQLDDSNLVSETILIDNDPIKKPNLSKFTKIKYLTKGHNIYVNPAWNWGVNESKNELIAICNDDILFNVNQTLELVLKNQHGLGCFGMSGFNFIESTEFPGFIKVEKKEQLDQHLKGNGWGALIFLKKSNWIEIPNSLKIWFGDDWISKTNKPVYLLRLASKIDDLGKSTTVSEPVFNPILTNDRIVWNKIFSNFN
jgi:hypothetical protein